MRADQQLGQFVGYGYRLSSAAVTDVRQPTLHLPCEQKSVQDARRIVPCRACYGLDELVRQHLTRNLFRIVTKGQHVLARHISNEALKRGGILSASLLGPPGATGVEAF